MPTDEERSADFELTCAGADLAEARDRFVRSVGTLELEITRTLDWREWVRRRPGWVLGLAFGLGLLLGRRH